MKFLETYSSNFIQPCWKSVHRDLLSPMAIACIGQFHWGCMLQSSITLISGFLRHWRWARILDEYDISSASYTNTITDSRILTPPYADLMQAVTSDGAHADLMHMFALSAAIGIPISSFCPSVSFMANISHPYNMQIYGRDVLRTAEQKIDLLWTLTEKPTNLEMVAANHIVFLARTLKGLGVVDLTSMPAGKLLKKKELSQSIWIKETSTLQEKFRSKSRRCCNGNWSVVLQCSIGSSNQFSWNSLAMHCSTSSINCSSGNCTRSAGCWTYWRRRRW